MPNYGQRERAEGERELVHIIPKEMGDLWMFVEGGAQVCNVPSYIFLSE